MNESTAALRDQLARVLDWEEAHVGFEKALDGIPPGKRGARAPGFEHSPWQLLEHIRIAQDDILDFCVNSAYTHTMKWPDDYWPKDPAPPSDKAWTDSIASCVRSREALKRLATDIEDLTARSRPARATRRTARHPGCGRSRRLSRRPDRRCLACRSAPELIAGTLAEWELLIDSPTWRDDMIRVP
jgi:hypothetical protein